MPHSLRPSFHAHASLRYPACFLPHSSASCHAVSLLSRQAARDLAHGSLSCHGHASPCHAAIACHKALSHAMRSYYSAQPLLRHCRSLPSMPCRRLLELAQLVLHGLHPRLHLSHFLLPLLLPRLHRRHGRRDHVHQLRHLIADGRRVRQLRGLLQRRRRGLLQRRRRRVVLGQVVVDGAGPWHTTRSVVNYWMLLRKRTANAEMESRRKCDAKKTKRGTKSLHGR